MKQKVVLLITVLVLLMVASGLVSAEVPKVELPVLNTSAGQSADVNTLNLLCEEAGIKYDFSDVPTDQMISTGVGLGGLGDESRSGFYVESYTDRDLYPDGTPYKTVLVAIGASLKGMGASGLSVDQELSRLDKALSYCKKNGIFIVGIHLGGVSTRGAAGSDNERMIDVVAKYADHLVVTEGGNQDGRFQTLTGEDKGVGLTVLKNAFELIGILQTMFD